jgi:hypothetical protein
VKLYEGPRPPLAIPKKTRLLHIMATDFALYFETRSFLDNLIIKEKNLKDILVWVFMTVAVPFLPNTVIER